MYTQRVATFLIATIGLLPFVAGTRSARAEEEYTLEIRATHPLMTSLGHPARPEAVDALVYRSLTDGSPEPALLAETLGHAGGAAALAGLVQLVDRGSSEVRTAALRAMEHVDLRSEDAARRAARHARESKSAERAAAAAALGAVGDGRHVDLLLGCATSADAAVRQSAFRALRKLTNQPIPPVHARWAWQWKVLQRRTAHLLPEALEQLDQDPSKTTAPVQIEVVLRDGWTDVSLVIEYVTAWFLSASQSKRTLACRLVSGLRLADCASWVEGTARFARAPDLEREADHAIEILGLDATSSSPTSGR